MWTISDQFKNAILSPVHTISVKMEVLTTGLNVVDNGEFYSQGTNKPQNFIVDGTVEVDTNRPARRTFNLTLLNEDAQWSPGSDWAGMFYVNRVIRLWRGIDFGDSTEFVPLGTFLIDEAEVVVERNMSMVVMTGTDFWKKLSKAQLGRTYSYGPGGKTALYGINAVVKHMVQAAGHDRFRFDPLTDRASDDKTLQKGLILERDDEVGDVVKKIYDDFGIDVYMDPLGYLTTRDLSDPVSQATVWEYAPGENNNLLSLAPKYSDDNLYNHIFVTGTASNSPVYANVEDKDPESVTNIYRLGRRTYKYESDNIGLTSTALKVATREFYRKAILSEDITLDAICNPAFEGMDIIRITEPEYAKVNQRYRIRSFSVPLASSRQTIKVNRAVNLNPS